VPENWTPDQIKNFQDIGRLFPAISRRAGGRNSCRRVAKTFINEGAGLKGVFDECWRASFAMRLASRIRLRQPDNRSTGETQKEMARKRDSGRSSMGERLIDGVLIEDFGEEDIEFAGRGRPD